MHFSNRLRLVGVVPIRLLRGGKATILKNNTSLKRPSSNNIQAMGSGRVTSYVWLTITVINIVSMSHRKSLNNETL